MDAATTVAIASEVANSQVVWSILCIALAVYVLWHSNKREQDSKEEKKLLLGHLQELTQAQQELTQSLTHAQQEQANAMKDISENLQAVEGRMDRMEKHIYKRTGVDY